MSATKSFSFAVAFFMALLSLTAKDASPFFYAFLSAVNVFFALKQKE